MSQLEEMFESGLPLVTSILALIPLIILLATYKRTKSPRILWAILAFAAFVVKGIALSFGLVVGSMNFELLELTEFGADFVIVTFFAVSFLWSFRGKGE